MTLNNEHKMILSCNVSKYLLTEQKKSPCISLKCYFQGGCVFIINVQ